MFGNLGMSEILILLVIVLLLFGAKRIPEIASSMGKGIREFKRSVSDVDRSINAPDPVNRIERTPDEIRRREEDDAEREPKRLLS
jgi:sec-independent protein translocase protein TatA